MQPNAAEWGDSPEDAVWQRIAAAAQAEEHDDWPYHAVVALGHHDDNGLVYAIDIRLPSG